MDPTLVKAATWPVYVHIATGDVYLHCGDCDGVIEALSIDPDVKHVLKLTNITGWVASHIKDQHPEVT